MTPTPAEQCRIIPEAEIVGDARSQMDAVIAVMRADDGMAFFRATDLTGPFQREGWAPGIYIEGWPARPAEQGQMIQPNPRGGVPEV